MSYITLPYVLHYLTIPSLIIHYLTLPYHTLCLTLHYLRSYHTLHLTLPLVLPYFMKSHPY